VVLSANKGMGEISECSGGNCIRHRSLLSATIWAAMWKALPSEARGWQHEDQQEAYLKLVFSWCQKQLKSASHILRFERGPWYLAQQVSREDRRLWTHLFIPLPIPPFFSVDESN
jgi:hypothetical protein